MAEPHATAATASLAGPAAAIPSMTVASALLGVPLEFFAWALFGGIVALMNAEPRDPPPEGRALLLYGAGRLLTATGVGGVFSGILVPVATGYVPSLASVGHPLLQGGAATLIGAATAFLPEVFRASRLALQKLGGHP